MNQIEKNLLNLSSDKADIERPSDFKYYNCKKCGELPEIIDINLEKGILKINCSCKNKTFEIDNDYLVENFSKISDKTQCDICNRIIDLEKYVYCRDCEKKMCENCRNKHQKNYEAHLLLKNQGTDTCPIHKKIYKFFCKVCKRNLCDDCLNLENHSGHEKYIFIECKLKQIEYEFFLKKFNQYIGYYRTIESFLVLTKIALESFKSYTNYKHFKNIREIKQKLENFDKNFFKNIITYSSYKFPSEKIDLQKSLLYGTRDGEGYKYEGYFNLNGSFEGYGKICYKNKTSYKGQFLDGKYNGYGKKKDKNETKKIVYEGKWKDNSMLGFGRIKYNAFEGRTFIGEIGHKNETYKGFVFDNKGIIYEGEFKDNKFDGYGIYYYDNNKVYKGNYKGDLRNGFGEMYKLVLDEKGQFVNDLFSHYENSKDTKYKNKSKKKII